MTGTNPRSIWLAVPRRAARRGADAAWWLLGSRVLLTSVPKCGTHLLRRLVNVIGMPARLEIFRNDEATPGVLREMLRGGRGQAVVAHLLGVPAYHEIARDHGARIVFITRDPRDQAVSHLFHYRTHTEHPLHPYFRDSVPSLDEGLMAVIRGFGPGPEGHLADVATFFRMFLPWREMSGVLSTTFERLVGPAGGGAAQEQEVEVRAILRHVGFPLASRWITSLVARRVFSSASPTFRAGRIGGWRQHFLPHHRDAFKEVAGQLLVDLGYERDLDW